MKKISKRLLSVLLIIAMLIPTGAMSLTSTAATVSIPDDAVEFNGHYYKTFEDGKTWAEAKAYCEELGGHLVTITSSAENNFVTTIFPPLNGDSSKTYYIGYNDIKCEGVWEWVTSESNTFSNWSIYQPDNLDRVGNEQNAAVITSGTYGSSVGVCNNGEWDDAHVNLKTNFICEWEPNIYNMGEETYSFDNFSDCDNTDHSIGHCFGMAVTSSGYYLDLLDPADVEANSCKEIYNLSNNSTVRETICYYHSTQGRMAFNACVTGRTGDMTTDWNETVNYVKNHEYDNKGNLVILYAKTGVGGHAINFLRYEVVDGQDRIYAYDNECPTQETYFYQDENGDVRQAVHETLPGVIDNQIALVYVPAYFSNVNRTINYHTYVIYAGASVKVEKSTRYLMYGDIGQGEHYVYEIDEDVTTVKITPLVNNASFTYLGQEYTFGEINDGTYAELTLSTNGEDVPEFEIFNNPADEPTNPDISDIPENTTKDCSCNCHSNAFMQFIHKILCFFYKLFGMEQYRYCNCGKAHW